MMSVARPHSESVIGRSRLSSSYTFRSDILLELQSLQHMSPVDRELHTFVHRQIRLLFSQDVILLLLLHICSLVVRLVEDELIRACSTSERIETLRVVRCSSCSSNSQAVAAIRTDYAWSASCEETKKAAVHVGGIAAAMWLSERQRREYGEPLLPVRNSRS